MNFENEHPNGNIDKKRKSLEADEKSTLAILLADDALSAHGYQADETVEVEMGEVAPGALAAVLLFDGRWFVGYIFFEDDGVILADTRDDLPSPFLRRKMIKAYGQVFRRRVHPTPCTPINIWSAGTESPAARALPVMTWQTDAHGAVVHADRLCRQFLGLSEEQMRAGEWKKHIHPDDRAEYLRSREQAIADGVVYRNSVRIQNAREEYCLVSIMLIPYWDNGQIIAWHAVAELVEDVIKRSA
jgi:PAS domain S-box-containing protein